MFNQDREDKLRKKLRDLNNTQDSIQTLSAWAIHYREYASQIVQIWLEVLKNAEVPHHLPLFNFANDVLQASRKRSSTNFVEAFAPVLYEAATLAREKEEIKPHLERILNIWEERCIYSSDFINELREALDVATKKTQKIRVKKISVSEAEPNYEIDLKSIPPEEYSRILSEYKSKNLVALIQEVTKLVADTKAKYVGVRETELKQSPEKLLRHERELAAYRKLDKKLEERSMYLQQYVDALERQKEGLARLEQLLHHSQVYYATQSKEARMVAKAYKNFTTRVKGVEKKLNKIKPVLLSPVPSPPADPDLQTAPTPPPQEPYPPPLPEKLVPPPLPPPSTIIENIPLPTAILLAKQTPPVSEATPPDHTVPPLPPPPLPPPPSIPPLVTKEVTVVAPVIPLLSPPEKLIVKTPTHVTTGYAPNYAVTTTPSAMLNNYSYNSAYGYYATAYPSGYGTYPYVGAPVQSQEQKKPLLPLPKVEESTPAVVPQNELDTSSQHNGCGDDMDLDESEEETGGVIEIFSGHEPQVPTTTDSQPPPVVPTAVNTPSQVEEKIEDEDFRLKNMNLAVGGILGDVRKQSQAMALPSTQEQPVQRDSSIVHPEAAFKAALKLPGLDDLLKTIATNTNIWSPANNGSCRTLSPPPFLPSGFNNNNVSTTPSPTSSVTSSQFAFESRSFNSPLPDTPAASHPAWKPSHSGLLPTPQFPPDSRPTGSSPSMSTASSVPAEWNDQPIEEEYNDSGYQEPPTMEDYNSQPSESLPDSQGISQYEAEKEYERFTSETNSYEDSSYEPPSWRGGSGHPPRFPRPTPYHTRNPPAFHQRFRPPFRGPSNFNRPQYHGPRSHRPPFYQPRPFY